MALRIFPRIKNTVLDLLFPLACLGCQKEGTLLCVPCREKLRWIPPSCIICRKFAPLRRRVTAGRTCRPCRKKSKIFAFVSPFSYDDVLVRELIHNLKYNRIRAISLLFAEFLEECLQKYSIPLPKNFLLIPIPLHRSRERVRGFNQAGLVAEELGRRLVKSRPDLNIGLGGDLLRRIKNTKPQTELSGKERLENVGDAFGAADPVLIKDRTIILLDDVKTTGATLEEAARTLKKAGVRRVWAITIAH